MSDDSKTEIVEAFKAASKSINELESIIGKYHAAPRDNIQRDKYAKINIPHNYIRTRYHFVKEYKLRELVTSQVHIDSISYALMQSDLHNYIINRFQIWGIVEKLFLKTAIINLVSIHEALIICSLSTLHQFCIINGTPCKINSKCAVYSKSIKGLSYAGGIELFEQTIGFGNSSVLVALRSLKDIRNNVHISLLEKGEFYSDEYTIGNYNKAIQCLHFLKSNLLTRIQSFKDKQSDTCSIRILTK